jgi:hypothetical protein
MSDSESPQPPSKKPISEKQLAANRANAARSTGPTSPAGKARSSQNGRDRYPRSDYNAHLVAIARNRYLIDASLDQADAPGFPIPPMVLVIDLARGPTPWSPTKSIQAELTNNEGVGFSIAYDPIADRSYRESPAWNDEALPLISKLILTTMKEVC